MSIGRFGKLADGSFGSEKKREPKPDSLFASLEPRQVA